MRSSGVVAFCVLALLAVGVSRPVQAAKVVDVSGTSWLVDFQMKGNIKGVGKGGEADQEEFYIGPNAGQGVAGNEIKIVSPGDETVFIYSQDGKGGFEFEFAPDELEIMMSADLADVLEDFYTTVKDVTVEVQKNKFSGKVNPGKSIKISWSLKLLVHATLDGVPTDLSATQTIKGKGVPLL